MFYMFMDLWSVEFTCSLHLSFSLPGLILYEIYETTYSILGNRFWKLGNSIIGRYFINCNLIGGPIPIENIWGFMVHQWEQRHGRT